MTKFLLATRNLGVEKGRFLNVLRQVVYIITTAVERSKGTVSGTSQQNYPPEKSVDKYIPTGLALKSLFAKATHSEVSRYCCSTINSYYIPTTHYI